MHLSSEHIDFEALAGKYLSGNSSPEEVELLESLVKSDNQKKKLFYEIKKSWNLAATSKSNFDTAKAWEKISTQISDNQNDNVKSLYPQNFIRKAMRIAAAVLILVVGSFVAYYFTQHKEKTLIAENQVVEHVLQDGSSVSLSYNSKLSYPKKFKDDERRVKLEGEAYFEVESLEGKPFIIETFNSEIHVIGTSFWVKSRKDEAVEVVVYSGKVAMITVDKKRIELTPGIKGVYEPEKEEVMTEENTNPNVISWKTKRIIFEETGLKEVFNVVTSTYGTKISIRDEVLEECKLTATFADRSAEDILLIIKETFNIRYVRSEGVIWVLGEGCEENN
jgi:transmembrane sensor